MIAAHPNATFGEIGRLLGEAWTAMSDEEKSTYREKSEGKKIGVGESSGGGGQTALTLTTMDGKEAAGGGDGDGDGSSANSMRSGK